MLLALVMSFMTASAYDLTVGTNEHGTITFKVGDNTVTTADEGDEVTVVITPAEGYVVNEVSGQWVAAIAAARQRRTGTDIDLLNAVGLTAVSGQTNQWTFTMERANMEISATYKKLLSNTDISITVAEATYTGSALTPEVTVKDGETPLTLNTDYTVSYSNNTNAALSTADTNAPTVTVTALGTSENYAGETTKTFTIEKAAATISFNEADPGSKKFNLATYTNTLSKTGDGTVAYTSSDETVATVDAQGKVTFVNTGTANITATVTDGTNYTYSGMTGYSENKASVTYALTIENGDITATASGGTYTYSGYSRSITVSVTEPASGYTIQYSTNNSTWSTTKPSWASSGTHRTYYKVTAPNYNDMTGSATVTINRASGSISFSPTTVTKTYGDANFTKTYSSKTGGSSISYSSDNTSVATVNSSTGEVTVKAAGTARITATMARSTNYTSASAYYTLTVNPADLSTATVALATTSYEYDGTAKEPGVVAVILNSHLLTAGTDYTVSYADNVNAGTATANVNGLGNYTGTASQAFTILPVTTTDGNVTVVDGGSETVLTINDMGNQQGKTVTPDLQVTTLNYNRSLNASDANLYTVCLPYAPTADAGLTYYTLTGAEGTTLQFDEITGAPQANTPYLVYASSTTDIGTENLNQAITMSQTVDNSFSAGSYVMKGTLSGLDHSQSVGKYILQSGNRWGLVDSDTHAYIPPFRAYIESMASGARMLDSSLGGGATGINSLRTTDRDGTERYFDLNGRRIENPKKTGVYIRNGRKEVLK